MLQQISSLFWQKKDDCSPLSQEAYTNLKQAIKDGNEQTIKNSVAQIKQLNAAKRQHLLLMAIEHGQTEIFKAMFKKGDERLEIFDRIRMLERGYTLLHIAAEKGHIEIFQYLLENGANPYQRAWEVQRDGRKTYFTVLGLTSLEKIEGIKTKQNGEQETKLIDIKKEISNILLDHYEKELKQDIAAGKLYDSRPSAWMDKLGLAGMFHIYNKKDKQVGIARIRTSLNKGNNNLSWEEDRAALTGELGTIGRSVMRT